MKNKRLFIILIVAGVLLLIPFVAMQFTDEVVWTAADFLVAGILLFGVGLACELVLRKVKKAKHRILLCAIFVLLFLLIWAELAVGIFGSPVAGS